MAENMRQFTTITTDEIANVIVGAWDVHEATGFYPAVKFDGPPGTGKTHQTINGAKRIAEKNGWSLRINDPEPGEDEFGIVIWQMANSSEEVISGLPWADKDTDVIGGVQRKAMVDSLPRSGRGILYLDEVLQAPYTQRFAAQLTYDRRLDNYYYLPDGWIVVMTSNSAKDRAGVHKMWTHFQNRVQSFEVVPTVDGALANFKHPPVSDVAVMLKFYPTLMYDFDPKKEGPFPTARTWDFCNTLRVAGMNPVDDYVHFQGYLGPDTAQTYRTTFKAMSNVPNLDELFANPDEHKDEIRTWWKNQPERVTAIAFIALRKLDAMRDVKFAARAIRIFEHAGAEIAAGYVAIGRSIDERHDDGESMLDTKEYRDFLIRNQNVLV